MVRSSLAVFFSISLISCRLLLLNWCLSIHHYGSYQLVTADHFGTGNPEELDLSVKHKLPKNAHPDIFIIGAPKSGTTSLYNLFKHYRPKMFCKNKGRKEFNYFSNVGLYNKGAQFYQSLFVDAEGCNKSMNWFDTTVSYLRNPDVPKRIHGDFHSDELHRKKFVVALRDPSYKRFSWYNHILEVCSVDMEAYMTKFLDLRRGSKVLPMPPPWNVKELCSSWACEALMCEKKAAYAQPGLAVDSLASFKEYVHRQLEVGNLNEVTGRFNRNFVFHSVV